MKQNDLLIGLIGGSGSGKSIFCDAARNMGYNIIDGDKIGHDVLKKGTEAYKEIVAKFGREILDDNGKIIRRKLASIVFNDCDLLDSLNKIVHPAITEKIKKQIKGKTIIDAAVLYKTPLFKQCDYIICVLADKEKRVKRICMRDGISEREAYKRINSQLSDNDYSALSHITLINDSTSQKFYEKVEECLKKL